MPYIDKIRGIHKTPEEAVAMGLCPECGRSLEDSSAEVEKRLHWPYGPMEENFQENGAYHRSNVLHRMKLIDDYYASHPRPLN